MGAPGTTRVKLKYPTYISPGYMPHAAGAEIDLPAEHAAELVERGRAEIPAAAKPVASSEPVPAPPAPVTPHAETAAAEPAEPAPAHTEAPHTT
jgi:hypothetical protein